MHYADGADVLVGDIISLSDRGPQGIIVGDIEAGVFADGYIQSDWDYLKKGLLVLLSDSAQAVLINDIDEDMYLVSRKAV